MLNEALLFEEHKNIINSVIWKNRPLLAALRLDFEDVSQQLSITMLSAIRKFDPSRSESLGAHIRCSLQYEILNIKRRYKPHWMTGVPQDCRPDYLYLDSELPSGSAYELLTDGDMTAVELSDFFESLSESEAEAINLKLRGYPIRRKTHKIALERLRQKYAALYYGQESLRKSANVIKTRMQKGA